MPLINDKVRKNAERCKQCAFLKMKTKVNKNDVLYDEAMITIEGILRASCGVCPSCPDFVAVYGMKPYEAIALDILK